MKPKIKIMNTKPETTDEEIQGYMNFESLMQGLKSMPKKPTIGKSVKITSLVAGIVMVALISYFVGRVDEIRSGEGLASKSSSEIPAPANKIIAKPRAEKDSIFETPKGSNQAKGKSTKTPIQNKRIKVNADAVEKTDNGMDSVGLAATSGYVQAEPRQGFQQLYEYFSSELKYPEEAVKDSIQGIVTVSFIINTEGKPEKIKVVNSLGFVFDHEVIRLIENMPNWKPATMNGKPVHSRISMPLTFRLERIKK
jgi:TonB family protein